MIVDFLGGYLTPKLASPEPGPRFPCRVGDSWHSMCAGSTDGSPIPHR